MQGFDLRVSKNKKETKAFSPEQANKFLEAAKYDRHGLIFEIALSSGMRPEEYLGLQWKDIDFGKCTASVQRALVWRKGGDFKFCEPKTAKSRRTVPLPKSILPKLKEHRRRQLEHRQGPSQFPYRWDHPSARESFRFQDVHERPVYLWRTAWLAA